MIDQVQIFRQLALLEKRFDNLIKPELSLDISLRALFSAYNSATDANVTGDGTTYTIICDTEIEDRNGDYNNATGVFLAPVDGYYDFVIGVDVDDLDTDTYEIIDIRLVTSNRFYGLLYSNPENIRQAGGGYFAIALPALCVDMDAGDTAYITVRVLTGTKTVDVYGAATNPWTFFQGYLLI